MSTESRVPIEVCFVPLPTTERRERSLRLRELLMRGALRFVRGQTSSEGHIDQPEAAVVKITSLVVK
jgi:hypothetical protein